MQTVGIRELKAKLSEYLRRVQEGESISVTDRGKTIACIAPGLEYPNLGTYDGSGLVRDPGTMEAPSTRKPRSGKTDKPKSYTTLLKETQKAWGYKTPKETLTRALEGYLELKLRIDKESGFGKRQQQYGRELPGSQIRENIPPYGSSSVLDTPQSTRQNQESYASLLRKAQRGGKHGSEKETLTAALKEYIRCQNVEDIIAAFGTIEFDPDWDYKKLRRIK